MPWHVMDTTSFAQSSYDEALAAVYPTVAAVYYRAFPIENTHEAVV